jgi:hypothetical protein
MPLQPAEKAALALWLSMARHLDLECYRNDDQAVVNILKSAQGTLIKYAMNAGLSVQSATMIADYLMTTADELEKLPGGSAVPSVQAAEKLLRDLARNVQLNGNGDGQAIEGVHCSCGVLDLAGRVEARVRSLLEGKAGLKRGFNPPIVYVTVVINDEEDDRDVAPFRVNGFVNIRQLPRTVTIVLKAEGMTCRDLWHLAYTLHHELVCHAFQGALAPGSLPNAHPSCHWTEGWMDTLAFDLVCDWLSGDMAPRDWLPLEGDDAKGELWKFHDHRYKKPPVLSQSQIMMRREARKAYRRLAEVLDKNGIAKSPEEAIEIAQRFTLAANTHPEANCDRLKTMGKKLRSALLTPSQQNAPVLAALACLTFSWDHDLVKLDQSVGAIGAELS